MNQFKNLLKRSITGARQTPRNLYNVPSYNCVTYSLLQQKLLRDRRSLQEKYNEVVEKAEKGDLKEIINMFWFASERHFDFSKLVQSSESHLKSSLNQLNETDLSLLSFTLGQSGAGTVDFWYSLEREVLSRLSEGNFRRGNFGRLVLGLAESGLASDTFWERVQRYFLDSKEDLNAEGLAYLIKGFGLARDVGENIESGVIDALRQRFLLNFVDMTANEQIISLTGWSYLDGENDNLWVVLSNSFASRIAELDLGALTEGIEALARVDRGTVKEWRTLEKYILASLPNFSASQVSRLISGFARAGHDNLNFWGHVTKHYAGLEASGCDNARVLNALAGTTLVTSNWVKELGAKLNIKQIKAGGLADWLLAMEKTEVLTKDFQKINKAVLENYKTWSLRERREFLRATRDSKNLSGDVVKALREN